MLKVESLSSPSKKRSGRTRSSFQSWLRTMKLAQSNRYQNWEQFAENGEFFFTPMRSSGSERNRLKACTSLMPTSFRFARTNFTDLRARGLCLLSLHCCRIPFFSEADTRMKGAPAQRIWQELLVLRKRWNASFESQSFQKKSWPRLPSV